jgi:hypothetical protein
VFRQGGYTVDDRGKWIFAMKKARLLSYMNVSIASAIGMLGLCSQADAGIVYFDVNPDLSLTDASPGRFGDINLDTGTYLLGSTSGNSFSIDPLSGGFASFSGSLISALGDKGFYGVSYSRGHAISGSLVDPSIDRNFYATINQIFFEIDEATGATFLPLRLDAGGGSYSYGWVQGFDFGTHIVITGFAFEKNFNTAILAGDVGSPSAVPEPGSLAVISGLFGLVVAANRRARKQNQPSMPEALTDLASGAKGVEKLRAS